MIIKQIKFDDDTGKLFLITNNNEEYRCNIYGEPLIGSGRKRNQDNLTNNIRPHSAYLPLGNKVKGTFQFPRPQVSALFNLDSNVKKETKNKVENELKRHLTTKQNESVFDKKEEFLCTFNRPLSSNIKRHKNDIDKIIVLIDNTIKVYSTDYFKSAKSSICNALKKFKQILRENLKEKKNQTEPNEEIKKLYKAIITTINRKGLSSAVNTTRKPLYNPKNIFVPTTLKTQSDITNRENLSFLSIKEEEEEDSELVKYKPKIKHLKDIIPIIPNKPQKEKPKETGNFRRHYSKIRIQTEGDLYQRNEKLLEKVNRIQTEKQIKMQEADLNRLKLQKTRTILGLKAKNMPYNHKVKIKKKIVI